MNKNTIKYKETGDEHRARRVGYHGTMDPRNFAVVPKNDIKDINKKYYEPAGKYYKTKFTIGFELEKVNLPRYKEYAIFTGYERDGSLNGRNTGEAITNILPLVPKGHLRNQMFELMFQAERVIDSDVNRSCGGHTTLCAAGLSSSELTARIRNYSGLIYALYRGRLRNPYCSGNVRMFDESGRGAIAIKSGGCVEFRLPSGVPSVQSLIRRYEIFFELMDFSVNRNRINFNMFLDKCTPILLRMYDYNTERVELILSLAKDFQHYINTGRVRESIREFMPNYALRD
jgi:hypothetical protein